MGFFSSTWHLLTNLFSACGGIYSVFFCYLPSYLVLLAGGSL